MEFYLLAVATMKEDGIDISHYFQNPAKAFGTEEEIARQFRNVREEIKNYCEKFIKENI